MTARPFPDWLPEGEQAARARRELLTEAAAAVPVGTWQWDLRTGRLVWDSAMHRLLGTDPQAFDERIETWRELIHPQDLPVVLAQADESLREGAEYHVRHRVRRPDGTVGVVEVRGHVRYENGSPARMMGRLWETTGSLDLIDAAARALRHMSDGFLSIDEAGRILYSNVQAEHILAAEGSPVGRCLWDFAATADPSVRRLCREAMTQQTTAGVDLELPPHRWYHLRLIPALDGLNLYLTDITDRRRREEERAAAQRASAQQAKLISELTAALSEALTAGDVVAAAADRVMPLFDASGFVIWTLAGDDSHPAGAVGYPKEFIDHVTAAPRPAESNPLTLGMRDRLPRFISSREEMKARYPHAMDLAALGGKQSWAFLPLLVSGRLAGICIVSFDEPRILNGEERNLLLVLSGLIAQALERARMYDAEHNRAQALQRGLLPTALPDVPAARTAARYLPASEGMLGGDWYDVIPLSADRIALVIGDVMGHGLPEAATMGRLRTAVHTLAELELPVEEMLYRLNAIVSELGDDFYATCLYALYDPATGACTFGNAGHPPPAVVRPDGTVHFATQSINPPLGAASAPFETVDLKIDEGSLLVLYTDGLVESAGRDVDSGLTELAAALTSACAASSAPGEPDEAAQLDRCCDALFSALLPVQLATQDDVALLVARTRRLSRDNVASWVLSEGPISAGEARRHAQRQLAAWGLDDLVLTTELLVSELVGNVVRHAKGPARLRLLRSWTLICEVSDSSLTTPQVRHAQEMDEGGRGLQLVAALAQRWGVRYTPDGKCIWTEQALPAC